jgi:hypothetical protein
VNFESHYFLARAAFPNQEHWDVSRGDVANRALQRTHGRAGAMNDVLVGRGHTNRQQFLIRPSSHSTSRKIQGKIQNSQVELM